MENKEEFAKQALADFLSKHSASDSISCIDEIVLSYMVSILEDLGSDSTSEDAFDVDTFTEMMEAYLPGFAQINSVEVCEWMFSLASQIGHVHNGIQTSKPTEPQPISTLEKEPSPMADKEEPAKAQHGKAVSEPKACKNPHGRRVRRRSKRTSSSSSQDAESCGSIEDRADPVEMDQQIKLLLEMFPASCTVEAAHFLSVARGDVEKAVQLMLVKQEEQDEETVAVTKQAHQASAKKKGLSELDDKQMKKHILQKYSYVDTHTDKKEHKPVIPKTEPKKLVRYLDSQVVTTKGHKFTEMKKPESEEVKKTYVNLKPARQYRFH